MFGFPRRIRHGWRPSSRRLAAARAPLCLPRWPCRLERRESVGELHSQASQPAYAGPGALARPDLPALNGHPSALFAARTCPLPRVRLTWCSPIDFPITGASYVGAEPGRSQPTCVCPDAHDNMLPPRHSSSRPSSPDPSSSRPSSSRPSSSRPSSSRPSSSRPSSSRPSSSKRTVHNHKITKTQSAQSAHQPIDQTSGYARPYVLGFSSGTLCEAQEPHPV
jgi:hypothetical protein